ncbi:uncharacterized protein F5Z01DRAFT_694605 [Emericellopsis atlantica]|uniref:Aminoglycoside phosphotransferase domain-containing protein n=1 Tax=Emericellopsis atlantica TaxID=2614577 RepID=A0A9P7ZSA0_9HYPO|nr:uncharacterized protein F5Z01DRAFT_694605 [Emericellopsis atlantica]KAG9257393.1 hypothetical protein F5Z01DRAFT_694605 [Emericellopsis atlantica]
MTAEKFPESYEDALDLDDNVIHEKQYLDATTTQAQQLVAERATTKALIRHHLSVAQDARVVIKYKECRIGTFNICFPVVVEPLDAPCRRLFLRCAMPHKLGEVRSRGAVDEKMSCEVATYAWMQEHCPGIRIPHLYGFGLADHRQFTHQSHRPFLTRAVQYLRRMLHAWLRPSTLLSHYIPHTSPYRLSTAYMILEDVGADKSQMLSNTWAKHRDDPMRRRNLYHGLAKTMLSLASIPQPRIGAFRFHADGIITLSNRPITTSIAILENDGAPRCIPRDRTYAATESYVSDMMTFHDHRLSSNRNAAFDATDCSSTMASKVTFRAVAHRYILEDRREGPFYLRFDDLHASNIFVDYDWNITSLVDLEWVNAQPAELLRVPYWLTDGDLGEFKGEQLSRFNERREEFLEIFEAPVLTNVMKRTWEHGGAWFWTGLSSVNGMHAMWSGHICQLYAPTLSLSEEETLSKLWCHDSDDFVESKVRDYEAYCEELKKLYADKDVPADKYRRHSTKSLALVAKI